MNVHFEYCFEGETDRCFEKLSAHLVAALFTWVGNGKFSTKGEDGRIELTIDSRFPAHGTIEVRDGRVVADMVWSGTPKPSEVVIRSVVDEHARVLGLFPAMISANVA